MKVAYETYLKEVLVVSNEKDRKVESIEDPDMATYMLANHPRFYDFVHTFGNPIDMVNLKSEGKNISQLSAKIELINMMPDSNGKTYNKKLLLGMSITDLKAMCSKLFKVDVL